MDRLVSDHDTVTSHRVSLERVGWTDRPQLPLPGELGVEIGDGISLSLAGRRAHARVERTLEGEPALRGAFRTRRLARVEAPEAELLAEWLSETGLGPGDPIVLDILIEGYAYGLRPPGERVVYSPPEPPDSSLAEIADELG
ncbi:hypothetical protein BRC62_07850 [Halobacteriales archaeon QH_10_67_13]|nr:MAG: hypothetical protein BRC62_07850 [Halobacteriales archaeon QH_10_67_13]